MPNGPETSTAPVLPIVAASAITSGTGLVDDDNSRVVRPGVTTAGSTFAQTNRRATSVDANAAAGVRANTKLWLANGGMSTGMFGDPVTALVATSVVW
jgi:hypothetical protein